MKLIAVKFLGIGPYAGEESIDFVSLSQNHIYLIDGETGAGKTMILDAIVYALYGDVGESTTGAKGRMRSNYLDGSRAESYVDLIFAVNGDYYRIRRTPEYQVPKAGGGMTPHKSDVTLFRVNQGIDELAHTPLEDLDHADAQRFFDYAEAEGNETVLEKKSKPCANKIESLINLNRAQFLKTIMLPQGEYENFLTRTSPEDRTDLLIRLFDLDVYDRIADALKGEADRQRHEWEARQHTLYADIVTARRTADELDGTGADMPGDAAWGLREKSGKDGDIDTTRDPKEMCESLNVVSHYYQNIFTQRRDTADEKASQTRKTATRAEQDRDTVARLCDMRSAEGVALRNVTDIEREQPRIDADAARLKLARKAKNVVDAQKRVEESEKACVIARNTVTEKQAALDTLPDAATLAARRAEAEKAESEMKLAAADEKRIAADIARLDELDKAATAEKDAQKAFDDAAARLAEAHTDLTALGDRDTTAARRDVLKEQLAKKNELKRRWDDAEERVALFATLSAQSAAVTEAEKTLQAAAVAQDEAQAQYETARDLRAAQQAIALARDLHDGEPCPVCGSTIHPAPRISTEDVPSQKRVKELEKSARDARDAATGARITLESAKKDLDATTRQIGDLTPDAAASARDAAKAEYEALSQAQSELDTVEDLLVRIDTAATAVVNIDKETAAAHATLDAATTRRESCATACVNLDRATVLAALADAKKREESARAQAAQLDEITDLADRRAKAQTALDTAKATLAERESQHDQCAGDRETVIADNGFSNYDEAATAALSDAETKELEQRCDSFEKRLATARGALSQTRRAFATWLGDDSGTNTARSAKLLSMDIDDISHAASSMRGADSGDDDGISKMSLLYNDDGTDTAFGAAVATLDTAEYEARARQARAEADEAAKTLANAQSAADRWNRDSDAMLRAADAWRQAKEKSAPYDMLSQYANGTIKGADGQTITLQTFAVTQRFLRALDVANGILADIHGGQYALQLADYEGRKGGKNGIAMNILDTYTGVTRATSTISGGEKFIVSLALALGLASAVQEANGGVAMDTLFIDEGFGTLSGDYLNDVMHVIKKISTGEHGRDIGIISHVDALRRQIPESITVTRTGRDSASTLRVGYTAFSEE